MPRTRPSRSARGRTPLTSRLANERLEPRVAPVSWGPTAAEQVLLERINDQRIENRLVPLAFDARMQQVLLTAKDQSIKGLKSALSKARVPWEPKDSITTVAWSWRGGGDAELAAEQIADGHDLTRPLGNAKYDRHRMVGFLLLGDSDPRNPDSVPDRILVADVTASIKGRQPIVTGVVYKDLDQDAKYDAGEGLRGMSISVTAKGIRSSVAAWETGGFSVPVKAKKAVAVNVTVSGPDLAAPLVRSVQVRPGMNARVNFVVPNG